MPTALPSARSMLNSHPSLTLLQAAAAEAPYEPPPLSWLELERQGRMAQNRARLLELGLPDLVQGMAAQQAAAQRKRGRPAKKRTLEAADSAAEAADGAGCSAVAMGEPELLALAQGPPAADAAAGPSSSAEPGLPAAAELPGGSGSSEEGGSAMISALFQERDGQRFALGPNPRPLSALPLPQLAAYSREQRKRAVVLRVIRAHNNRVSLVDRMGGDERGVVSVAKALRVNGQVYLVMQVCCTAVSALLCFQLERAPAVLLLAAGCCACCVLPACNLFCSCCCLQHGEQSVAA